MTDNDVFKVDENQYKSLTGCVLPKGNLKDSEISTGIALCPSGRAALSTAGFMKNLHGNVDIESLMTEINRQSKEISGNDDMERCQQLLVSQALTLDTIFHSLAKKAVNQEYLSHYEVFIKLAMKAQAQSRCTMEAISKIKNPPHATFVKQQNISGGHQQVNNNSAQGSPMNNPKANPFTRTKYQENKPNELLEECHGERLDFGAEETTSRADSKVEAMEQVHRTKN